jgi:hypothetical protein
MMFLLGHDMYARYEEHLAPALGLLGPFCLTVIMVIGRERARKQKEQCIQLVKF